MPNFLTDEKLSWLNDYLEDFFKEFEIVIDGINETHPIYDYRVDNRELSLLILLDSRVEPYTVEEIRVKDFQDRLFISIQEDIEVDADRRFFQDITIELFEEVER